METEKYRKLLVKWMHENEKRIKLYQHLTTTKTQGEQESKGMKVTQDKKKLTKDKSTSTN